MLPSGLPGIPARRPRAGPGAHRVTTSVPTVNVLLIMGHPRRDSLCAALAEAYLEGAVRAGASLRTLVLADLDFDPNVRVDSPENQALEPDLVRAARWLEWAEHVVFVYPTWWGTMPALLKGFLDRLVLPGVAFRFHGPGAFDWEKLWVGKSAQIITTMDTPPPIYRWIYKAPGTHAMRSATLGYCGVKPVHALEFGSVRTSTLEQRRGWLEEARRAGWQLHAGVRPAWHGAARTAATWLRALRLQFYPMTWAAYTVGALAAAGDLAWPAYLWGYACLFLMEAATVFGNDYVDVDSDRANRNFGLFTGGSRVLVDKRLEPSTLRAGAATAVILAAAAAGFALRASPQPAVSAAWLLLAAVLALGYTLPPLKLSYRGLGELDVAVTHGALMLLLGFFLQGGPADAASPWLLSLPLSLAILPSITLAGVPDRDADESVGKHTLAVLFGTRGALLVAAVAVIASASLAVVFDSTGVPAGLYRGIGYVVLPHAALCTWLIHRQARRDAAEACGRIDRLLVATLTYMIWFVALPLYRLA